MRAGNFDAILSSPIGNPYSKRPEPSSSERQGQFGFSVSLGPPFESGQGLLKTTSDHLASLQQKLLRVQSQLKSPLFDRLDTYGALNSVLADADRLKRELTAKISALFVKRHEQRLHEREANRSLEEKVAKLRLMALQGAAPQEPAERSYTLEEAQVKLVRLLALLELPDPQALAGQDLFTIESAVSRRLAALEVDQDLAGQNRQLVERLRQIEDELAGTRPSLGEELQKRVVHLELENKKLAERSKAADLEAKRHADEERARQEQTLAMLEERIYQVEGENQGKLQQWQTLTREAEDRCRALLEEKTAVESRLGNQLRDQDVKHRARLAELEASNAQLRTSLAKAEHAKEDAVRSNSEQLGLFEAQLKRDLTGDFQEQLKSLELAHGKATAELNLKLQRAEKARSDYAEKNLALESALNRAEVAHREELTKLKDQLLHEGAKRLRSAEEGMAEREKSLVQPYADRIAELEKMVRELNENDSVTTKTYRGKLEELQTNLNALQEENLALDGAAKTSESTVATLKARVGVLERELQESKASLSISEKGFGELQRLHKARVEELERRLAELTSSCDGQAAEVRRLQADNLALVNRVADLEAASQNASEMEGRLKEAEEASRYWQTSAADLQASVDKLTSDTLALNDVIASLDRQTKEAALDARQAREAGEAAEARVQAAEKSLAEEKIRTEKARHDGEMRAGELERCLREAQNSAEEHHRQWKATEGRLATAMTEFSTAQEKLAAAESRNKERELANESLREELARTRQARVADLSGEALAEIERLRESLETQKQSAANERDRLERLRSDLERREADCSRLSRETEEKFQQAIEAERGALERQQSEFTQRSRDHADLAAELERQKAQLAERDRQLSVTQESLKHKSDEVALQLEQIRESEALIKSIQQTVWEEQQFLAEKNETIRALEVEKEELQSRMAALQAEIEQLKEAQERRPAEQSSQDNLLGSAFLKPTSALLSSSPGLGGGLKTVLTNSFDLDDGLDKSFEVKESMAVPPSTSAEKKEQPGEAEQLRKQVRLLERQLDSEAKEADELRNKLEELEAKAHRLQSELGKVSSEKTAVENLLYQTGVDKKARIRQLVAELETAEARQHETVKRLQKEYERQKTLDLEKLERELKQKYEGIVSELKSQLASSPDRQAGKFDIIDERKNSWLEYEDESEELDGSPAKERQHERSSNALAQSQIVPKQVEQVETARSVPDKSKSSLEGGRGRHARPDDRRKRHQDADYQRKPADGEYFVKKVDAAKDEKTSGRRSERDDREPTDSWRQKKTAAREESLYSRKPETSQSEFVPKDVPRSVTSSIAEPSPSPSPAKPEPPRKEVSSKNASPKKEEVVADQPPKQANSGLVLLSDLLADADLDREEQTEPEWFGFDEKGKINAVRDPHDGASQKDEIRSDLASSQFVSQSGRAAQGKEQAVEDQHSEASSRHEMSEKANNLQESLMWSSVLKDDDFDRYYNDDLADSQFRGSVDDRPQTLPDEDKTASEKKKKKKKKAKAEMDLRLISPRLN